MLGQKLTLMLAAIAIQIQRKYIKGALATDGGAHAVTSAVRCVPPAQRDVTPRSQHASRHVTQ